MFGMAGGSAGQFAVAPMIAAGIAWSTFWAGMGVVGLAISALLLFLLPRSAPSNRRGNWLHEAAGAFGLVFRNLQSILCGITSALVLFACLVWILYGRADVFPPYVVGLTAGLASGAAMLPCTVIKEANPAHVNRMSTGVVNFLNFTFSALLGPVFAWLLTSVAAGAGPMSLSHYQTAFQPLLYGVALAILLTLMLRETGPAVRPPVAVMENVL
jgi:hypothetical protein